ncbi:unnamed protein product [Staurois parvus]|uniref:Uncharacterized protein n=1 Tax=Staurois parvus TaxID=386267 RepID=A0ABN9EXJ9_9NEOB|nr:unnamed protein product [Staurois parvus]
MSPGALWCAVFLRHSGSPITGINDQCSPISATCQCPSVSPLSAHQCHISAPISAHQSHISVPIRVTNQCRLLVPVSAAYQCPSVPPTSAHQYCLLVPVSAT